MLIPARANAGDLGLVVHQNSGVEAVMYKSSHPCAGDNNPMRMFSPCLELLGKENLKAPQNELCFLLKDVSSKLTQS